MKWIRLCSAVVAFAGLSMTAQAGVFGSPATGGCKSCGCAEDCQPAMCRPTIARPCAPTTHTYQRAVSTLKPPCCGNSNGPGCCAPVGVCGNGNACGTAGCADNGAGCAPQCAAPAGVACGDGCGDGCGQAQAKRGVQTRLFRKNKFRSCSTSAPQPLTCGDGCGEAGCGSCGNSGGVFGKLFRRNSHSCAPAPLTCGDDGCGDSGCGSCGNSGGVFGKLFRRNSHSCASAPLTCGDDGCAPGCAAPAGTCGDGCGDSCSSCGTKPSLLKRLFRRNGRDATFCGDGCTDSCSGCASCAAPVGVAAGCGDNCGESVRRCKGTTCEVATVIHESMTACYAKDRRSALRRLGKYDCVCHPEIMNAYIYGLNDADERVRAEAADGIGDQLKKNRCCCSPEVVSALTAALGDCDRSVRREATRALKACGYDVVDGQCCGNGCTDGGCAVGNGCTDGGCATAAPAQLSQPAQQAAPVQQPAPEVKAPAGGETIPAPAPPVDPNAYFPSRLRKIHASRSTSRSGLAGLFGNAR